ncbi:hypothetical protein [Paludisphaera mucosa]|uniref:Uncharacterized protein n=1 Tax=Paludisphaera mucosa TaxID=3030827 RepID=A0ABT6FCW7_9BACT|nr:hypothetical protein [Paludisphaera mucosa]MDG3005390.1 hypothetical protein [Paludisphaera mucosa]
MSTCSTSRAIRELISLGGLYLHTPGRPGRASIYSIFHPETLESWNPDAAAAIRARLGAIPAEELEAIEARRASFPAEAAARRAARTARLAPRTNSA